MIKVTIEYSNIIAVIEHCDYKEKETLAEFKSRVQEHFECAIDFENHKYREIVSVTASHPVLGNIEIDLKEGDIHIDTLSEVTFTTIDGKLIKKFMIDTDLIKMLYNQVLEYSKEYSKLVANNDVLKTIIRNIVRYSETTTGFPPNWQNECLDKIENL